MHHLDLPISGRNTGRLVRSVGPTPLDTLDLASQFGNDAPVELEIGVGKGRFLLLSSITRPDTNFFGVEYARKYFEMSVDRLGKRGVTNARVVHAEAVSFLRSRVRDAAISTIHVYFPDPWPKKRHQKRRLFCTDGLDQLARVLTAGGLLRVATDHTEYASVIRHSVDDHPLFEAIESSEDLWRVPGQESFTALGFTNFEIKYRQEGRAIHRFIWRRGRSS